MDRTATIVPGEQEADYAAGRALFQAYAAELNVDLCFQGFAEELENLRSLYGPPRGCLLLGAGGRARPVGCVALRDRGDGVCEMKRLYVRARRTGAAAWGGALAVAIVDAGPGSGLPAHGAGHAGHARAGAGAVPGARLPGHDALLRQPAAGRGLPGSWTLAAGSETVRRSA